MLRCPKIRLCESGGDAGGESGHASLQARSRLDRPRTCARLKASYNLMERRSVETRGQSPNGARTDAAVVSMRIVKLRALRGPNVYSVTHPKLVVLRLDLEAHDEQLTSAFPTLAGALAGALSMDDGCRKEIERGAALTRLVEIIAVSLQSLAGMDVALSRSEATAEPGVWNIVFSYDEEEAGLYAGEKAVVMADALLKGETSDDLKGDVERWIRVLREIREDSRYGPSTEALIAEAARRGIPYLRLNPGGLLQLGFGCHQQRISASITENTRIIAVDLACDKFATKQLLEEMSMPVPKGRTVTSESELARALEEVGFPVAIKPLDANQGKGITVNVNTLADAEGAFRKAQAYSIDVIVEQSLSGPDFRALVVNNKLVAVARREPAHVDGDGKRTIAELVAAVNRDPRRGFGHENVLTRIELDDASLRLLAKRDLTPDSVLGEGEYCALKTTANLSTGGTATDVTNDVHPYNVFLFERIAHFIGLDVGGIDVVAPDLSTPLNQNGGGVVEVNAAPGLRMHLAPSFGTPRNVAEPIIDMLFPPGTPHRIPILALTGTNGKTTTTRLLAHLIKNTGKTVGYTTTDGIYVNNYVASTGDTTGPRSAQVVLKDPEVEVAVLETARGGLLRSGLGFDYCDIGVVTNVAADHLGLGDVHTLEELARVKSVVAESARRYAVLNADDDLVYRISESVRAKVALFSMQADNPRIEGHINRDGIACVLRDGWVVIQKGRWRLPVERAIDIPLTYSGRAAFNIQNVLAATLAAYCHGLTLDEIRVGLTTFTPSVAQTPGRLNLLDLGEFTALIDYAHNPAGMNALGKFLEKYPASRKTAVGGGTGDRRDEDLLELGELTARMFDRVVVREEADLRGRELGVTADLVIEGMKKVDPNFDYERILDSEEAIRYALDHAQKDELVAILSGDIDESLRIVGEYREKILALDVGPDDIPNRDR